MNLSTNFRSKWRSLAPIGLLILLTVIFVVACGSTNQPPAAVSTSEEIELAAAPTVNDPSAGKVNLVGSVYSTSFDRPIPKIPVSLAIIVRDEQGNGAYFYDPAQSPQVDTDDAGFFVFQDIDPGEYVIVLGNVEVNAYHIVEEAVGTVRIFELPADQIVSVGTLAVQGLDVFADPALLTPIDGYPAEESYP